VKLTAPCLFCCFIQHLLPIQCPAMQDNGHPCDYRTLSPTALTVHLQKWHGLLLLKKLSSGKAAWQKLLCVRGTDYSSQVKEESLKSSSEFPFLTDQKSSEPEDAATTSWSLSTSLSVGDDNTCPTTDKAAVSSISETSGVSLASTELVPTADSVDSGDEDQLSLPSTTTSQSADVTTASVSSVQGVSQVAATVVTSTNIR